MATCADVLVRLERVRFQESLYGFVRSVFSASRHLSFSNPSLSLFSDSSYTGYRPILEAAKTFAFDKNHHSGTDSSGSDSPPTSNPDSVPKTPMDEPAIILDAKQIEKEDSETKELLASTISCPKGKDCCKNNPGSSTSSCSTESTAPDPVALGFKPYDPATYEELIFPPFLAKQKLDFDSQDLCFVGNPGTVSRPTLAGAWGSTVEEENEEQLEKTSKSNIWLRPGSLASLIEIISFYDSLPKNSSLNLRSGNTEAGIEHKFKHSRWDVNVFVSAHLCSLGGISVEKKELTIGANYPLNDIAATLRLQLEKGSHENYEGQVYNSILSGLSHFASNQIRNVSTLGGNVR